MFSFSFLVLFSDLSLLASIDGLYSVMNHLLFLFIMPFA